MSRTTCLPLLLLLAVPLRAQAPADAPREPGPLVRLVRPGSTAADRARLDEILGRDTTPGGLLRSPSADTPLPGGVAYGLVLPEVETVFNSALPLSLNDGAMWAGRGATLRASAGAFLRVGPLTAVLAPQVIRAQNRAFDFLQTRDPGLSEMLPPWRVGETSADLPVRFGDRSLTYYDLGQSTLSLDVGPVAVGASSEEQWWGPGVRNAIVLSNNAAGIPHLFARTRGPRRTPIGRVEAKWMLGGLTESLYFDNNPDNDLRSFSAVALTLAPAFEPDLTVGAARAVYAPVDGRESIGDHALDALLRWRSPRHEEPGDISEQIVSLFARWSFPGAGAEIYGEWARNRVPVTVRDFLVAPNHTQGYTLGLQWAGPWRRTESLVRVQAEATFLERSPTYRQRETPGYYVSARVPQGYTHRGQVVGAAIGPGASSQWIAADYLTGRGSVGVNVTRIRWDNDAFYSRPNGDRWYGHDVSMIFGLRGATALRGLELSAELAREERLNFHFQNPSYIFGDEFATDIGNTHLRLTISPRLPRE